MAFKIITILMTAFIFSCAGPNPNPGERTVDMSWSQGDYSRAFNIAKQSAESGQPWAQLRMGIFYYNGWGVAKDYKKSIEWFLKAENQFAEGQWANGVIVGASGKSGYFNQNSDALIAKYNLAQMYEAGEGAEKDLKKAYKLINQVIENSNGKPVFFCCEFSQSRYFTQEQFSKLKSSIEKQL